MILIAFVFNGRGFIPVVLRMWPKYWISLVKKWHLLNFMDNLEFQSLCGPDVLQWFAVDDYVIQIGNGKWQVLQDYS